MSSTRMTITWGRLACWAGAKAAGRTGVCAVAGSAQGPASRASAVAVVAVTRRTDFTMFIHIPLSTIGLAYLSYIDCRRSMLAAAGRAAAPSNAGTILRRTGWRPRPGEIATGDGPASPGKTSGPGGRRDVGGG